MRKLAIATLIACAAGLPATAFAADLCTGSGATKDEAAIRKTYEDKGYKVKHFGHEDGCIEIKGFDAQGKKVEMYVSPWTGEAVKTKSY